MHKLLVLVCLALFCIQNALADCKASAKLLETPGEWDEMNVKKRIFELHVTNTDSECSIGESVTVKLDIPAGCTVGYQWGMNKKGTVQVKLSPGQTHAGAGFLFSGNGKPVASVVSIEGCSCSSSSTTGLGPQNPTDAPTPAPTNTPSTPAPTDAATPAPTTGSATPAPTDAATPAPTTGSATPAPTPAPTDAATPAPTTGSATPAPTDAATPAPTTGSATPAPTPAPTDAATPAPTPAATPAPTPAPTDAATPAPTPAATPAPTPAPTDAATPAPTPAATPSPTPAPTYYTLGLRIAVFTCTDDDIRVPVAKLIMDGVGSQYDIISYAQLGASGNLQNVLYNVDGSGKYYAFLSTTELACWSTEQNSAIANYESINNVKMVILYCYPNINNGVSPSPSVVTTKDSTSVQFAPALHPSATAVNFDADISLPATIYFYPASIVQGSNATAAYYITHNNVQKVGGAILHLSSPPRVHLEMYFDQASWSVYTLVAASAWFNWVTNGVFAGSRRVEVNCHMDDVFMNTGTYDNKTHEESIKKKDFVRINPSDMDRIVSWQTNLNLNVLPAGSNFTLTFPYNAATVEVDLGGYSHDPLFLHMKTIRDHFIWESHTYEHPYLDNLTYQEVHDQYNDNVPILLELFDVTSLSDIPDEILCTKSTVTPSISGTRNANALQAMWDFGFKFIVGDNSRDFELSNAYNLYHTFKTNATYNGFAGMIVVPRHATAIYYFAAHPQHVTDHYNYLYTSTQGQSTFKQIVDRDIERNVWYLMAYRHDPFMFHQANMIWNNTVGYPDNGYHSLVSYWTDELLTHLQKYNTLPIISRTHDRLGQVFLDRESRDACGFNGKIKFRADTKQAVGLHASASATCVFGVSGIQADGPKVQKYETYGSETTTWFNMDSSSNFDVTFVNPISPL